MSAVANLPGFTTGQLIHGDQRDVQRDVFGGSSGYGVIYADPPWHFETISENGRDRCPDALIDDDADERPLTPIMALIDAAMRERSPATERNEQRRNHPERHYATMSLDDIKALPVGALAAKDCVLLLWAVDPLLPEAIEVGRAWGFAYKTVGFTWAKLRRETSKRGGFFELIWHKLFPIGTGYWTRSNPEQCLLFTRGNPKRLSASIRQLVIAPRREHSRKPDEIRDSIRKLTDGPYLELFARAAAPGWDAWGNQVERFAAEAA